MKELFDQRSALLRFVSKRIAGQYGPVLLAVHVFCTGCQTRTETSGHKAEAPANVERLPVETELCRITLTEAAERRLGIRTVPVRKQRVERRRTLAGEVMIPNGRSIVVSAPVSGAVTSPANGEIPQPGTHVAAGDAILTLVPLLSPERDVPTPAERVQITSARATLLAAANVASGDVDRSRVELEAATVALQRATALHSDKAGSKKAVDDAHAQVNIAQSVLRAAEDRVQQLTRLTRELESTGEMGKAVPLVITSPQPGVVRNLMVSRGQSVTAGAPLAEVANTDSMWVKVPVYVGLLSSLRSRESVHIVGLDGRDTFRQREARSIDAPPSADPSSTTVDLFFELDNRDGELRPGQRVGVDLPLQDSGESLTVDAHAVLLDVLGGTWVYVRTAPHAFERRRVMPRYTLNGQSILAEGPAEGTEVVVEGAAELFGTEFGAGK